MKKKISTIIFGLRNILAHAEQTDFHLFIAKNLGIKDHQKSKTIKNLILQYALGEISTELLINWLIKESELPVQALDLIRLWNKILLGVPEGTSSLLKSLKKNIVHLLLPIPIHSTSSGPTDTSINNLAYQVSYPIGWTVFFTVI